jgi:hypothetical protein
MAHDTIAPPDQPPPCRRFRLTDAMILTAGAAVFLAGGVHLFAQFIHAVEGLFRDQIAHKGNYHWHWPWSATRHDVRNTLWYGFQIAFAFLSGMAPAYVLLRLMRPRPPLRALLRQPGIVAALAMIFGLFWVTGCLFILFPEKVDSMTAAPIAVGGTVAASWLVLALSRQWKSEPGWVDRLGRILGVVAIVTALVGLVIFRI